MHSASQGKVKFFTASFILNDNKCWKADLKIRGNLNVEETSNMIKIFQKVVTDFNVETKQTNDSGNSGNTGKRENY